jgi:hypothetical protein
MTYSTAWEKPILRLGDGEEAERALELLDANDIDFELRERHAPSVSLEWNGIVYRVGGAGLRAVRAVVPAVHAGAGRPRVIVMRFPPPGGGGGARDASRRSPR